MEFTILSLLYWVIVLVYSIEFAVLGHCNHCTRVIWSPVTYAISISLPNGTEVAIF